MTASRDAARARMAVRVVGKSEAQGRGAIGRRRDSARLRSLGQAKGARYGSEGEGGRQDRRIAGAIGRSQCRAATKARRRSRLRASLPTPPRPLGSRQLQAARELARALQPVSVFISRKTRHLYVRRAFEPILEIPVAIQEPERPIGTHVFTAMERTNGETGMRWSVISLEGGRSHGDVVDRRVGASRGPEVEPTAKEPSDAKTALDRIVIPPEVLSYRRDGVAAVFSDHL